MGQKLHLYLWNGHCVQNFPFPPKEQIYDWTGLFGVLLLGLFLEVIIVENITFFLDFFFTVPSNSPISGLPQNNYISLRWPWKDSPMGNAKLQNWFSVGRVGCRVKMSNEWVQFSARTDYYLNSFVDITTHSTAKKVALLQRDIISLT